MFHTLAACIITKELARFLVCLEVCVSIIIASKGSKVSINTEGKLLENKLWKNEFLPVSQSHCSLEVQINFEARHRKSNLVLL